MRDAFSWRWFIVVILLFAAAELYTTHLQAPSNWNEAGFPLTHSACGGFTGECIHDPIAGVLNLLIAVVAALGAARLAAWWAQRA